VRIHVVAKQAERRVNRLRVMRHPAFTNQGRVELAIALAPSHRIAPTIKTIRASAASALILGRHVLHIGFSPE
jgi:hypothetical protein